MFTSFRKTTGWVNIDNPKIDIFSLQELECFLYHTLNTSYTKIIIVDKISVTFCGFFSIKISSQNERKKLSITLLIFFRDEGLQYLIFSEFWPNGPKILLEPQTLPKISVFLLMFHSMFWLRAVRDTFRQNKSSFVQKLTNTKFYRSETVGRLFLVKVKPLKKFGPQVIFFINLISGENRAKSNIEGLHHKSKQEVLFYWIFLVYTCFSCTSGTGNPFLILLTSARKLTSLSRSVIDI